MSAPKGKLELCPCGERPKELYLDDNGWGSKGAQAAGSCCGEWNITFQTNYHPLDSTECMKIAVEEWNKAARKITR